VRYVDTCFADLGGPGGAPVVVDAGRPHNTSGPVLVALDDDQNPAVLAAYGRAEALRRGVALRVVYIWTDCRPPDCDHHLVCHPDLWDAARLLAAIVNQHLSADEASDIERDVLHDADPASALVALSASASLLIVGASSRRPDSGVLLGDTTRGLVGRTRCPLAVVPHASRAGVHHADHRHRCGNAHQRPGVASVRQGVVRGPEPRHPGRATGATPARSSRSARQASS
jgi:nucleotide-binding universal stress UspA family protein